jgi:exodeoxyribonuclease VII large subunit
MILPEQNELKQTVDYMTSQFADIMKKLLLQKEQILIHLNELYKKNSFDNRIKFQLLEAEALKNALNGAFQNILILKEQKKNELSMRFDNKIAQILNSKENILKSFQNMYILKEPTKESKEGFAQIVKNAQKTPLEKINEGDEFELQTPEIKLTAKALKKQHYRQ